MIVDIAGLTRAYRAGMLTPADHVAAIRRRIAAMGERPIWINLVSPERLDQRLGEIETARAAGMVLPLYGIPFAVKDNIDVAGLATTAGCPDFAYQPARSASVVSRLEAAGAILIGKTNLDQFATGLVGTRSPYGICSSVFSTEHISGGSSAGSAVAVAAGLVSFALGTDTAGSGRVPAAFNNLIGLKPTRGLISCQGVVPACRTLDCVSIFALNAADAAAVLSVAAAVDSADPYSRPAPAGALEPAPLPLGFRFGVPAEPLEFFGDEAAGLLFETTVARLEGLGGVRVPIDFTPFRETAELLYAGPWVVERLVAIESFAHQHADKMDPVVRDIILGAARVPATAVFQGVYRLAELIRMAEEEWQRMDLLVLPTTGTTYRISEIAADPVRLNSNLGAYTNFANLMDLSAIAVPAGFRGNGLPFGVTLFGRAFQDGVLAALATRLQAALPGALLGGTGQPLHDDGTRISIAVVGAHLSGQPLNRQLTGRGARLVRTARTRAGYSLYLLPGSTPAKPGLIFTGNGTGGIELEIWEMSEAAFGGFVDLIPPPLGIGTLRLDDGASVKGFLCEPHAVAGARDITGYGGWRNWLADEGRNEPRE